MSSCQNRYGGIKKTFLWQWNSDSKPPPPQCFHTYSCIYMHAFNKKIAFWPFLLCHVVGICSVMESGWREYCVIHYQLFERSDLPTKRTTRFFFTFYILLDNTHKQKKKEAPRRSYKIQKAFVTACIQSHRQSLSWPMGSKWINPFV